MKGIPSLPGMCSGTSKITLLSLLFLFALGSSNSYAQSGGLLDVAIIGNGAGTVTSDDGNINCPGDCSQTYFSDTDMITLTATPVAGSAFAGWTGGGCSGTASCTVTMTGAQSVQASFTAPVLNVVLAGSGSGSVQSDVPGISCPSDCSETYSLNDQVTLTASASAGSTFTGWQGGGCAGTGVCNVTMSASVGVTATFDNNGTPGGLLSVSLDGTGSGSVSSDDQNIQCPEDCSASYSNAVTVTLTASPDNGSSFSGWQGACTGTGTCTVTMSASRSVTAVFDADTPMGGQLTVNTQGTGIVSSDDEGIFCPDDCSETYQNNDTVILTADAGNGFIFAGWQGAGCSGTGSCSVTMSQDRNVTAIFDPVPPEQDFLLAVDLTGSGTGSVVSNDQGIDCPETCSRLYLPDSMVTLSATAGPGSVFAGWQGAGCSGTAPCDVNMSGNRNVTAVFELVAVDVATLTVSTDGTGGGSVTSPDQGISCPGDCSEDYPLNTVVTLTATAEAGSVFTGWQGAACTGTGSCTVTVSQDQSVNATFDVQAPAGTTLTVATDGSGDGAVQSDDGAISCPGDCSQSYTDDEVITLMATAATGSFFTGWQGGGCSGTDSCVVTMTDNRDVLALFQVDDDTDKDLVPNQGDQCPNTPLGETVNTVGCSVSQPNPEDDDQDGVPNTIDQCPNSAAGAVVDEVGCSDNEDPLDDDVDGVANTLDQCPDTPPGTEVDSVGCADDQQPTDNDMDGVPNAQDQCANTSPGASVDALGCSDEQVDSDSDGVIDSLDACPDTAAFVAAVDSEGCPTVLQIGNQLGDLMGLGFNEQRLGAHLDEICPMLVKLEDIQDLTDGQGDLRDACLRLKNTDTTEDQAAFALREISLTGLASQKDYMVDIATSQYRHIGNRMNQLKGGGQGGVSVSGLNLGIDGQAIPGHVIQSTLDGLLGMGAGDSFADFGKLGLFIQGDLDFGERDETSLESGYEFDSWSLSLGGDYRFTDTLFFGASLSLGEVEVDFDDGQGGNDISNWALSVYSGWSVTENLYIDGLISYGESELDSVRNIRYTDAGGAFDSSHNGDTDGDQLFIGINTGYVLNSGSWRFGPTASIAYLDGSIDGFTETSRGSSSQAWNFDVEKQDYESLRLSVGGQVDYIINTSFGVIIPGLRLSYVVETEDGADEIGLRLVNNPFDDSELSSNALVVRSDTEDSGYLDTSFNLSGQFVMGFSGFLSYQFYSSFDDYSRDGWTIGARWDKPF
jgi:uncharacterized protein YhjY with autotransporter beta-barrel domain